MKLTNCKNCGAVLTGNKCEYCGTQYFDFCEINPHEEVYIKMGAEKWIKAHAEVISCDYYSTFEIPRYEIRFSGLMVDKKE